jgi:UDP-N-acetylmuramyl tripeptide synthase
MGISHVAYEASSHGLDQYRAEGVPLAAAAFTNFSRDHLDYHPTMDAYFEAKMRLFDEVIEPGRSGGVDRRCQVGEVIERARKRGLEVTDGRSKRGDDPAARAHSEPAWADSGARA